MSVFLLFNQQLGGVPVHHGPHPVFQALPFHTLYHFTPASGQFSISNSPTGRHKGQWLGSTKADQMWQLQGGRQSKFCNTASQAAMAKPKDEWL